MSNHPELRNVTPYPGTPIPRWQVVEFDIADDVGAFQVLQVDLVFATGLTETAYTLAGGFAAGYSLGSSAVPTTFQDLTLGFHFALGRRGGWEAPILKLRLTVLDDLGNELILPGVTFEMTEDLVVMTEDGIPLVEAA